MMFRYATAVVALLLAGPVLAQQIPSLADDWAALDGAQNAANVSRAHFAADLRVLIQKEAKERADLAWYKAALDKMWPKPVGKKGDD